MKLEIMKNKYENKKKEIEREKQKLEENNMKLNINNLEQKYQKQVKDIQDSHSRIYSELINNNKELEKEIKILRAENEAQKNKKTNNTELNKKIDEINQEKETEKENICDIADVKSDIEND